MSSWPEILTHVLTCGILAALVWAGLVAMSADRPIRLPVGWWQGMGIVALGNGMAWLLLALIGLRWLWVWAVGLGLVNVAIGYFALSQLEAIQIPPLWIRWIHPLCIAAMLVLLAGALGMIL